MESFLFEETNPACFHVVDGPHDPKCAVCLRFLQEFTVLNEFNHLVANKSFHGMIQLILLGKVSVFLMNLFDSGSEGLS